MSEKKKIKKKELLRRIEDLELKVDVLRDKLKSLGAHVQTPVIPFLYTSTENTQPICPQCGIDPNKSGSGTCTSLNCPYSLKITC
jgi:hypothetical protein